MPSHEGEKVSKMPKMIDLESTSFRISTKLANKPRQKDYSFAKLSLSVIGARDVAKNTHIFLNVSNQHIKEINRHFDGTLNHYVPMVFASNQEKKEFFTFKNILLQPYKSYLNLSMIKEVE